MILRVKEILKEKEITQKSLADQLGITAIGLNQILRKGNPNLQTLERIADALGVHITDLFEREGDFIAFVRRNGSTYTFQTEQELKEFVVSLEEGAKWEIKEKEKE